MPQRVKQKYFKYYYIKFQYFYQYNVNLHVLEYSICFYFFYCNHFYQIISKDITEFISTSFLRKYYYIYFCNDPFVLLLFIRYFY